MWLFFGLNSTDQPTIQIPIMQPVENSNQAPTHAEFLGKLELVI